MKKRKKLLLSVDIEGISNVNKRSWLNKKDKEKYYEMCIEMTKETNVAVDAAIRAGYDVSINDAHSIAKNIIPEMLDSRTQMLKRNKLIMVSHIEDFDAVAFIGYHGMAGSNSFCAHTNSTLKVKKIKINEVEMSEGMINSIIAKHHKVPVMYISGTDESIKEMKEFMPDLPGTVVLNSINFENATTVKDSRNKISEDFFNALKEDGQTCDFPTENLQWEIEFNNGSEIAFNANIIEGFLKYRIELGKITN